jgi:hypothetical protein
MSVIPVMIKSESLEVLGHTSGNNHKKDITFLNFNLTKAVVEYFSIFKNN